MISILMHTLEALALGVVAGMVVGVVGEALFFILAALMAKEGEK
jgi:hypothetical protein